jgi:D-alanyl-D-alanine dipeptidase/SAM-dependent methyltransferase
MAEVELYDNLAEAYDALISWKRRLSREKPFFRRVFRKYGVRRVLDSACGTGMHAIAFHDWGYYAVGSDISARMIGKSRENADDRPFEFVQAGFTELGRTEGLFDAVTCLGNSLPHVLTDDELDRSLACMFDMLIPGGIVIIHGNNYDRILARRERFMPLAQGRYEGRDYLFVRFFDFDDPLIFNVVTLSKHNGRWRMFPDSSRHRALTHDLLLDRLQKAGFCNMEAYGGYPSEPFVKEDSDNLILVAQRPHDGLTRPRGEPISALDRIPIRDDHEPLVSVSQAVPEVEVRDEPTFVRETVARMLREAQSALPSGYRLRIKQGYRSLERQREMYEGFCGQLAEQHPGWPTSLLRREVNKFLAPPDAKHPPGHSTGGAVDATLIGPDGEEVDMTSSIVPTEDFAAVLPTYSRLVTPRAARNRQFLVDAMLGAGFSNYPGEWWHYSYGDSAWAVRCGEPSAVYGAADVRGDGMGNSSQ